MRIPFVPSLPGPAAEVARRWVRGDVPEPDGLDRPPAPAIEGRRAVATGAPPDRDDMNGANATPGSDTHSTDGANGADPRLATPPLRVDRASDAARNPVLTAADVDDRRHVTFVADPFVVRTGDTPASDGASDAPGPYHCFFEVKRHDRHPLFGLRDADPRFDIGHATSPAGREWTYRGVVLPASQAEHTYPHVLRHDGDWLLVPSPAGSTPDELRIYRATDFPGGWELVDSALAGAVRIDPTPFRYDGTWFLLHQAPDYTVRLRYSDRLVGGDWHEHPASPLFDPGSNDIAPGGRPLVRPDDGVVDLFFRRGTPGIVEAWRVVDPTRDRWRMHELPTSPVVAGSGEPDAWDERNVHHVDAGLAHATGSDLVVVDGQDRDRRYRLGVARTREFGDLPDGRAVGGSTRRTTLTERTVHPGERAVLTVDDVPTVPEAGWYRASVRPVVESDGPVTVAVTLAAGDAEAAGTFDAAGDGRGHVALGPVGLDRGDRPVVELRHDGTAPIRVTGGRLCLWGW